MIRKDRNARGGGVEIVVKDDVEFVAMADIPDNESIWCRIIMYGSSCVIGAVYRPPSAPISFLESIEDYLCNTIPANTRVIIAGDFNLPGIQREKLEIGSTDVRHCEARLDIALRNDLTQIVIETTRSGTSAELLLDLVFIDSKKTEFVVTIHDGISDYKLALRCIKQVLPPKRAKRPTINVTDFFRSVDVSILDQLEMYSYSLDKATDIDILWKQFKAIINFRLEKYVPKRVKAVESEIHG